MTINAQQLRLGANFAAGAANGDELVYVGDFRNTVNLATDAALPAHVDAGAGIGKTITGGAVGILTVDGVAVTAGMRILVKNEGDASDGIYECTTEGTAGAAFVLTRATDSDESAQMTFGSFCMVAAGTVNGGKGFYQSNASFATLDTDTPSYSELGAANIYTSNGTLTGNRTVTMGGNNLAFEGAGAFTVGTTTAVTGAAIVSDGAGVGISLVESNAGAGILLQAQGSAGNDITISNTAGSVGIAGGEAALDAVVVSATAGGVDLVAGGAVGAGDVDITSTNDGVNISAGHADAAAITIAATNAAGGITATSGTAGVLVDTTGHISLDSTSTTVASNLSGVGAAGFDMTIQQTAGSVNVIGGEAATDAVNVKASNAAGGINIEAGDGSGASNISILSGAAATSEGKLELVSDPGMSFGVAPGSAIQMNGDVIAAPLYPQFGTELSTTTAQTAGFPLPYQLTALSGNIQSTTRGVAATSDPIITVDADPGWAVGDILIAQGTTLSDGLYEVKSIAGTAITMASTTTNGAANSQTFDGMFRDQVAAQSAAFGTLTKVNISVMRTGTDGVLETASGNNTGSMTFTDLSADGTPTREVITAASFTAGATSTVALGTTALVTANPYAKTQLYRNGVLLPNQLAVNTAPTALEEWSINTAGTTLSIFGNTTTDYLGDTFFILHFA